MSCPGYSTDPTRLALANPSGYRSPGGALDINQFANTVVNDLGGWEFFGPSEATTPAAPDNHRAIYHGDLQVCGTLTTATTTVLPPGSVTMFAGSVVPSGWLACNGAAVSRTTFAALFTAVGVTFGPGDGVTTFNVPDCRGRQVLGVGLGAGLTNRVLGAAGGAEVHTMTTLELVPHTHVIHCSNLAGTTADPTNAYPAVSAVGDLNYRNDHNALMASNVVDTISLPGAPDPFPIMDPFIALNMIIKT